MEQQTALQKLISEENELTQVIQDATNEIVDNYCSETLNWINQQHLCTFMMLGQNKEEQCKKLYNGKPPQECDCCPMLNYVALDHNGKIMFVERSNI